MEDVFQRLDEKLRLGGVKFTVSRHEPVFTSEQAAAVRGVSLASGAKALILRGGDRFVLFVMPADRKLDNRQARAILQSKSIRFASRDEVLALTGLQPGAIPPFGSLFQLPTYCDRLLGQNATINFNAGDNAISVQMAFDDYVRLENPGLVSCSVNA